MIFSGVLQDRISAARTWHSCPSVLAWYAHRQNSPFGADRRPDFDNILSAAATTAPDEVFMSFAEAIATATGLVS
jgi:hypothetical protein